MFFALETPGKRAAVVYWLALLATALPVMHRVASSRRLPTIILRKVGTCPRAHCILGLLVICGTCKHASRVYKRLYAALAHTYPGKPWDGCTLLPFALGLMPPVV